jgi:hypothetical protein
VIYEKEKQYLEKNKLKVYFRKGFLVIFLGKIKFTFNAKGLFTINGLSENERKYYDKYYKDEISKKSKIIFDTMKKYFNPVNIKSTPPDYSK